MISERMRSPTRTISRGICWSRRMTPSARPRSTTTWPNSTRLTTPVMTSLARSLNSSYWRSRSASRTFWKMTCLAAWAAIRPNSIGGSGSTMKSPTRGALLELLRALQVDLLEMILGLFDHFEHAPQAQVAGFGVELGADVVLGAVAGAGGALDRVFHRLDDDALVDQLLARDGVGDREQLCPVGADGSGCGGH